MRLFVHICVYWHKILTGNADFPFFLNAILSFFDLQCARGLRGLWESVPTLSLCLTWQGDNISLKRNFTPPGFILMLTLTYLVCWCEMKYHTHPANPALSWCHLPKAATRSVPALASWGWLTVHVQWDYTREAGCFFRVLAARLLTMVPCAYAVVLYSPPKSSRIHDMGIPGGFRRGEGHHGLGQKCRSTGCEKNSPL